MKDFEKTLINLINEYEDDYGTAGTLEELFPDMTLGELVVDMYNHGMIPEDVLEKFLNDE